MTGYGTRGMSGYTTSFKIPLKGLTNPLDPFAVTEQSPVNSGFGMIPLIGNEAPIKSFSIEEMDKIRQTINRKSLGTGQFKIPLNNKTREGL